MLPLLLAFLLATAVQPAQSSTASGTCGDAAGVGGRLKALVDDVMGVADFQAKIDSGQIGTSQDTRSGAEHVAAAQNAVVENTRELVNAIKSFAKKANEDQAKTQTMDETTHTECCQLSAKSTSLDSRWGSKLINKKQGCYRGAYGHMSGAAHAEMPKVEESFYALAKQHLSRSETATIKWQYIGSETGWYTIYPSAKQTRCDSYDPRFRPWYAAAASVPKAVVVVVDTSGSMGGPMMAAAIEATQTVIDTLGPSDAFQVIDFDMDAVTTTETCMTTMIPATAENKKKLKAFVGQFKADGNTGFDNAFDKVDAILKNEVSATFIGDKPIMVLFMTDGAPSHGQKSTYLDTLRSWKSMANPPTIITFGFGPKAKMSVLDEIMQVNTGDSAAVAKKVDEDDIRTSMAQYYQHSRLAHKRTSDHVAMTAPYWDFGGIGMVVTISIPLYTSAGKLWGVAGVDISMGDLVLPVKGTRYGMQGYSFLMDTSRGSALSHPLVPSLAGKSPPIFFAVDLESNKDFKNSVLPKVMQSEGVVTGEVPSGLVQLTMSHGGTTDGMTFKYNQAATYHYKTLDDLPICVIVVLVDGDESWRFDPRVSGADTHATAQGLNGKSRYGQQVNLLTASKGITSPAVCSDKAYSDDGFRQVMRMDTPTVTLAASAFTHPQGYLELKETLDTTHSVEEYLNGAAGIEFSFASMLGNKQLAYDAYGTSYLNDAFRKSYAENDWNIGIYIGTPTGQFRVYPGGVRKKDYNPVVRPWYKRALAYPGKAVLSAPYTDAAGAGTVVTLSQTIHARGGSAGASGARGRIVGVVGLDFKLDHVQNLLMSGSAPGIDPRHCAIIDDSLKVVVTDMPSWQPSACSGLANRWDKCFDPTSPCWKKVLAHRSRLSVCDILGDNVAQEHYALEETSETAADSLKNNDIAVKRIPGTNTFLVHATATAAGTDPILTKALDFRGDCTAMFKGMPPRKSGATPLCAAAAAVPIITPPQLDESARASISVCQTRGQGTVSDLVCGSGGKAKVEAATTAVGGADAAATTAPTVAPNPQKVDSDSAVIEKEIASIKEALVYKKCVGARSRRAAHLSGDCAALKKLLEAEEAKLTTGTQTAPLGPSGQSFLQTGGSAPANAFYCIASSPRLLAVTNKDDCAAQVGVLNKILATCPTSTGELVCDSTLVKGATVLSDVSICSQSAAAINAVVRAYRGSDTGGSAVECTFDKYPFDATDCEATATTLNEVVEAFDAGQFEECKLTRPCPNGQALASKGNNTCRACGAGHAFEGDPPVCHSCQTEKQTTDWTIEGYTGSCANLMLAEETKATLDIVKEEAAEDDDPCGTGCIVGIVIGTLVSICLTVIGCVAVNEKG